MKRREEMATTGNNGRARTVSAENMKSDDSSDAWMVVDQDAYGLLGLQQAQVGHDEAADKTVQEAFKKQVALAEGDDTTTTKLYQALKSVCSQATRNGYDIALAMRPGEAIETENSAGIAAFLYGKDAPYGPLLDIWFYFPELPGSNLASASRGGRFADWYINFSRQFRHILPVLVNVSAEVGTRIDPAPSCRVLRN